MKRNLALVILVAASIVLAVKLTRSQKTNTALLEQIATLESQLASRESPSCPVAGPAVPTPKALPRPSPLVSTNTIVSSAPVPQLPFPDLDLPGTSGSCRLATILSDTQLASTLTWNSSNGGYFVGDLPAGSIVEVQSPEVFTWSDYPQEHGLYVEVVEAPKARQMERQTGYIELSRIKHKQCNLGAEFER